MGGQINKEQTNQPVLLVNVAHDDPTRGDVAGWSGLAKNMAEKINGRVVYADYKVISEAYPGEFKPDATGRNYKKYQELLARYLEPYGPPDFLFGHGCTEALTALGQCSADVTNITSFNEKLSSDLLGERTLVSHHLTPEVIKEEGELFDKMHPNAKWPIISAFLAAPGENNCKDFAEKIVAVMSNYPEATIYLCSSRRTSSGAYELLEKSIKQKLEEKGLSERIDILGYAPNQKNTYNPYKGLIARSKHFVVWGYSLSMMSEALYSGKTVYLHNAPNSPLLMSWKGLTREFNDLSDKKRPYSKEFKPVNLTDRVADALLKRRAKELKVMDKSLLKSLSGSEKDWGDCLKAIRQNFHSAEGLGENFKTNPAFVKAALNIRGFALQHFPAFKDDKDTVLIAAKQNKNAYKFASKALLNNEDMILELFRRDSIDFEHIGSDLLADRGFASKIIAIDASGFRYLSPEIRADRKLCLRALEKSPSNYAHIDESLKNELKFIEEVIDIKPAVYIQVVKDNPAIITKDLTIRALEKDCAALYDCLPKHLFDDDDDVIMLALKNGRGAHYLPSKRQSDIAEIMLAGSKLNCNYPLYASERLKKDHGFLLQVLDANAECVISLPEEVSNDESFMLKALLANPEIMEHSEKINGNRDVILKAVDTDPKFYEQLSAIDDRRESRVRSCTSILTRVWESVTGQANHKYLSRDPEIMQIVAHATSRQNGSQAHQANIK